MRPRPPGGTIGRRIYDLFTTPAMMLVPRVSVFFLSPPFAPLWGAAGDHFIVPRTPFRMATCAMPSGSNIQSRALSNLLWFALHWRKSVLEMKSR